MTDEYQDAKDEATRKNLKVFRPIDKNASYDPKTLVKSQGQLGDLEGYIQALSQPNGSSNIDAKGDLSGLLYSDSSEHFSRTDAQLMSEASEAYSFAVENMGRYVENNAGQAMNRFDGKSLINLVLNSHPMYLTKNEKHDNVVADIMEFRAMNSSNEKTVAAAQNNLINKIMKDKEIPDWVKASIQRYAGRQSAFVEMISSRYLSGQKKALSKYLTKNDKPDEGKLRELINNSLRAAYDQLDNVPSGEEYDKERNKVWENTIRPCYLAWAGELHSLEKKKIDEKDSKKQEEKARKAERQSLGMAA